MIRPVRATPAPAAGGAHPAGPEAGPAGRAEKRAEAPARRGRGSDMHLHLPDEIQHHKDRMRRFVERELLPLERELPPFRSSIGADAGAEIVRRLKTEGLWGLAVPAEYGGGGLGLLGLCALREALAHSTLWSLAWLLGTEPPILLYDCNEEQKRRFLLPAIRGERYGCFALTERDAGSDAAAITLTAEPDGSGHYVLNGHKLFSSHADEADFALVFGRTAEGITLFLVEHGTPGFRVTRQFDTMGGDRPSELIFEDCRVPAANILGIPGKAFDLAQKWFACDRIALQPPVAIGAGTRCLALARDAGVAPAGELADLALRLDAARQMVYHAAWKADQGLDMRHEASMVKATATTAGLEVVDRVMRWFGPDGYSRDLPMERYYRDIRRFTIAAGTYEIQQFVVARGLLKGYARPDCADLPVPAAVAPLRRAARQLVGEVWQPLEAELPQDGPLPAHVRAGAQQARRKAGLWGLSVPADLGGRGLGWQERAAVYEELHKSLLGMYPLGLWAEGEVPAPLAAADPHWTQICLTGERTAHQIMAPGLDVRPVRGGSLLDGEVAGVPAFLAEDLIVLVAGDGRAWLLPPDTPGRRLTRRRATMGDLELVDLSLERCLVADPLPHAAPDATPHRWRSALRATLLAAGAVGAAERCLEAILDHARHRQTFGKPIGDRQAIQWMIADAARELHAARLLVHRAAALADQGQEPEPWATSAQAYAADAACHIADRAIQVHGGYGYTRDLPFERIYRNLRWYRLAEATETALAHGAGPALLAALER